MTNRIHRLTWHDGIELLDARLQGHPFGRHSHDAYAIGVVERGVGGNFHRGEKRVLPPNTLSLMSPDEPHDGFAISDSLHYKVIYVSETSMRHILGTDALHGFADYTASDVDGIVSSSLYAIHAQLKTKRHAGWRLAVDSDITSMLETLMQRHSKTRVRAAGKEPRAVTVIKDYLDSLSAPPTRGTNCKLEDSVTLQTLADMVGLKPNYMLAVFTRHAGVSPYAYWMARRIELAKRRLAQGHSIVHTALELGFYDQSHFSRTFKRFTGTTPGKLVGH
jgi:AraC-like DNA-binding protein